jgi:hypothetical protein
MESVEMCVGTDRPASPAASMLVSNEFPESGNGAAKEAPEEKR